ncbi:MAG: glutaredoxin family protein [Candidatus Saccharibacteria bacterium]
MNNVNLYTTASCSYCHMAKEYLDDKGIKYKEIDISNSLEATNWVINHTGQAGVPVTDFDGNIVVGFDRQKIDDALKQ